MGVVQEPPGRGRQEAAEHGCSEQADQIDKEIEECEESTDGQELERGLEGGDMIRTTRIIIGVAAASLIVASLIHLGVLMDGYSLQQVGRSEAVIGTGMLVGLALTWLSGRKGLWAGVASLSFGLLGALVGLFTIVVGERPSAFGDVLYHLSLVAVLVAGLVVASRALSRTPKSA